MMAKLSRREHEALAHLMRGLSNREIAACLGISTNTVNKHIQQVFAKLSVRNGVEAVTRALAADTLPRPGLSALPAGHDSVMSTAETHEVAGGLVPALFCRPAPIGNAR
jgi:DNA-binding CsgD family transcriptional regulator